MKKNLLILFIQTAINSKAAMAAGIVLLLLLCMAFLYYNVLSLDDIHPWLSDIQKSNPTLIQDESEKTPSEIQGESDIPNVTSPQTFPAPVPPPAAHMVKGWYLYINLDELKLHVYKNGEYVKTFPVSGGKRSTPSPLGTWKVISKDTWGEGFGGGWIGINVPYGIYGIHGTNYPWLIGKSNASKGCIRMKNSDLKELYRMVPHGTIVAIVHNNPPFRILKSGDIGSDVVAIQAALKKLGYYKGSIDGRFGSSLKASVIKFQKAYRLTATGKVDQKTYNLISGATGNH